MTKAQLKAGLQKLANKVCNKRKELNSRSLKELMDLNERYGEGNRWCCYETNLIGIIRGGNKEATDRALRIYREFVKNEGAYDTIMDMWDETNGLNF